MNESAVFEKETRVMLLEECWGIRSSVGEGKGFWKSKGGGGLDGGCLCAHESTRSTHEGAKAHCSYVFSPTQYGLEGTINCK